MLKKLTIILIVLAFAAVSLSAETTSTPIKATVTTIGDGQITITLDGEKAAWIKKSAPVKFSNGTGKVLSVTADDVSPVVVTVKTKLASKLKVGDEISFQKGKAMSGC